MASEAIVLPPSSSVPFVGRRTEREVLAKALGRASEGHGSTWFLEGTGGIGKTRLAQWTEEEARRLGFQVRWGRCLKEALTPLFPWLQVFRGKGPEAAPRGPLTASGGLADVPLGYLPPFLLVDDAHVRGVRDRVAGWAKNARVLHLSRDRPSTLRTHHPGLAAAELRWLSRVESEESLPPVQLDLLGERAEQHLRERPGGLLVIEGLEYLVTQNSFVAVQGLLQLLRDQAEATEGHLVVLGKPGAFDRREVALLETLGTVAWSGSPGRASGGERAASGGEIDTARPPALVWLDYLDRLEAEAGHRPQCILLDDLQWGDPASISAVQFLARNLRRLPVLLVATVRDDREGWLGESVGSNLSEVRAAMEKEGILSHLKLQGLRDDETEEVVNGLLPAPWDLSDRPEVFRAFVERSGGNPYLALSTTRMLVEEGILQRRGSTVALALGEGAELPQMLPGSVRSALQRRLALLTPGDRAVLEVGAVQGRAFDLTAVAQVLHRSLEEVRAAAERLETSHRFLLTEDARKGRMAFTHALSWEGVLAEAPAAVRRAHALALADWWVAHRPSETSEIARLFWEAGEAKRGLPWVGRALEEASRAQAGPLVERYTQWRLVMQEWEQVPVDERAMDGLRGARALFGLGDYAAVLRTCRALLELPLSGPVRLAIEIRRVRALTVVNVREARALWGELEPLLPAADPTLRTEGAYAHANLLVFEGRGREAREVAAEALAHGGATPDVDVRSGLIYSWSFASNMLGQVEGVAERLDEGLAQARAAGLPRAEALLLGSLTVLQQTEGDLRGAEGTCRRIIELFHRLGSATNEVISMANRSDLLLTLEEPVPALEVAHAARELSRRVGFARGNILCEARIGDTMASLGQAKEGARFLARARQGCLERGWGRDALSSGVQLGNALRLAGDLEEAHRLLGSMEREVATSSQDDAVAFHRLVAHVRFDEGDLPGARSALGAAEARLGATGSWSERVALQRLRAEIALTEGDRASSELAWAKMNEVRQRIGLPARPIGELSPHRGPDPRTSP